MLWSKWLIDVIHKNIISTYKSYTALNIVKLPITYPTSRADDSFLINTTSRKMITRLNKQWRVWLRSILRHSLKGLTCMIFWRIYILQKSDWVLLTSFFIRNCRIFFASRKQKHFQRNGSMVVKQITTTNWFNLSKNTKIINWSSRSPKL